VDVQTFVTLAIIAFLIGCSLWLASHKQPEWRRWTRLSGAVIAVSFLGLAGLFATVFLSGWYGGIGD
jgi:hypothetical protein